MLIVNIIMCSAVSCNCTQKDQTEEIHHDAWAEYDTVKNAWSSSASGASGAAVDRHSLHSVPIDHSSGQSQYAARDPSPYHPGRSAVLYDDGDIRDSRSYANSAPHPNYSHHYAMAHRNGSSIKY
jgi:hypothetical protein